MAAYQPSLPYDGHYARVIGPKWNQLTNSEKRFVYDFHTYLSGAPPELHDRGELDSNPGMDVIDAFKGLIKSFNKRYICIEKNNYTLQEFAARDRLRRCPLNKSIESTLEVLGFQTSIEAYRWWLGLLSPSMNREFLRFLRASYGLL